MNNISSLLTSRWASRWRQGIDRRLVIGIGGGSGSGKSTIAASMIDKLAPWSVEIVSLDRFFKAPEAMPTYHSSLHGADRPDFNHPDSVRREEMVSACSAAIGEPSQHQAVIIEGILALHYPELRSLMHLRCYVTVEVEEMLRRRKQRNLAAGYGGTEQEIDHYNRECVEPQHRRFNAPTARHADLLIPNDQQAPTDRDRLVAELCAAVQRWRAEPAP